MGPWIVVLNSQRHYKSHCWGWTEDTFVWCKLEKFFCYLFSDRSSTQRRVSSLKSLKGIKRFLLNLFITSLRCYFDMTRVFRWLVLFSPLIANFSFFLSEILSFMLLCVIILPSATLKAHKTSEFHSPPVGDKGIKRSYF